MYACCRGGSDAGKFVFLYFLARNRPSKLLPSRLLPVLVSCDRHLSVSLVSGLFGVTSHTSIFSVSARHRTARILQHARRLVLVAAAAVHVVKKSFYCICNQSTARERRWANHQSECNKATDFQGTIEQTTNFPSQQEHRARNTDLRVEGARGNVASRYGSLRGSFYYY